MRLVIASGAGVFVLGMTVLGTVVEPPTFNGLASSADRIIVTETISVTPRVRESGGRRAIVTDVAFRVERVLKGSSPAHTLLTFLGGTAGDETLAVAGIPRFVVGDRDVLFISRESRAVSPLVGFMHGRFRIVTDSSGRAEYVASYGGSPVRAITAIGRSLTMAERNAAPVTLQAFTDAIAAAVQQLARR